jgi:hypothetical protein
MNKHITPLTMYLALLDINIPLDFILSNFTHRLNEPINNTAPQITETIATILHQVQSVVISLISVKKNLMWFRLESQGSTIAMKELVKKCIQLL